MEIEKTGIEPELGPVGIIREALDLLATHSRCFILIQVRLLLPLLVFAATATFFDWNPPLLDRSLLPLGSSIIPYLPHSSRDFLYENDELLRNVAMVMQVIVLAVDFIVLTFTVSLSLSSILYAVALNYNSERVSFEDVVHGCLPRLWMRLTLTIVYNIVISCGIVMVLTLCTDILLVRNHTPGLMMVLGVTGLKALVLVASVILDMLFTLAWAVTIFEKDYGWAAVRRARKLLKGRWGVALSLELLAFVPNILLVGIQIPLENQSRTGLSSDSRGATAFLLERVLLTNCFTSAYFQLKGLCAGVQYVSFKAYQMKENPDNDEIVYKKAGYELFPGEVDDVPKLGESKAETFV